MGSSDVAPASAPAWLVRASTVFLGLGVVCWSWVYILMTRRNIKTKSYGMPILGLMINVSWEIVYGFYVAEMPFEKFGFCVWLILDMGLVWTTIRYAPDEWATTSPFVGRHMAFILSVMLVVCCWGHYAFASWWLEKPGTGHGDKTGKWLRGEEGYDTTEASFWSAGISQVVLSVSSLSMLVIRGHSGGVTYTIWALRFIGSLSGMVACSGILWYYWPEAHSYFTTQMSAFILGISVTCDIAYLFVLRDIQKTERRLPNGRLVGGGRWSRRGSHNDDGKTSEAKLK